MARILGREGADPKVSRMFYIAVTQQVLLFGAESWVLTGKMEAALDAFQGRVARRLTGRTPRRGRDGGLSLGTCKFCCLGYQPASTICVSCDLYVGIMGSGRPRM